MKILVVTAFDKAFADYGFRMLKSVKHFHPEARVAFCDFGDMPLKRELAALDVEVLTPDPRDALPDKPPRFRDLMLWPFVKLLAWDWLVWIDADTLVLKSLKPLWSHKADFVGHPDRDDRGLVLTCNYDATRWCCVPGGKLKKYATGVWATRSRGLLYDCWYRVVAGKHAGRDSDVMTAAVYYGRQSNVQLDGNEWNFGRQLVPLARYENGRIVYDADGKTYEPYTVGFSRVPVDGVDQRLTAPAIEQFYREVIE